MGAWLFRKRGGASCLKSASEGVARAVDIRDNVISSFGTQPMNLATSLEERDKGKVFVAAMWTDVVCCGDLAKKVESA